MQGHGRRRLHRFGRALFFFFGVAASQDAAVDHVTLLPGLSWRRARWLGGLLNSSLSPSSMHEERPLRQVRSRSHYYCYKSDFGYACAA